MCVCLIYSIYIEQWRDQPEVRQTSVVTYTVIHLDTIHKIRIIVFEEFIKVT